MRHIVFLITFFCSVTVNTTTCIASCNPPTGGLKNTYVDPQIFKVNSGDVISCRCYDSIPEIGGLHGFVKYSDCITVIAQENTNSESRIGAII